MNGADKVEQNLIDLPSVTQPTNLKRVHVIANVIIKHADSITKAADSQANSSILDEEVNRSTNLADSENIHLSQVSDVQIINSNKPVTYPTSNSPSITKCIDDYLKIPDKPQRKNRRQIERVPFAVTSKLYQESFEAKRAIKVEVEKKKLERKRKREEKAAIKADIKNKKVCKSTNMKIDPVCFVCKKRVAKSKYWTCDTCKNNFHNSCIPKKHKMHLPDIDDGDPFMCHNCYEEGDDEETVSEQSFEDADEKCEFRDQSYQKEVNNNILAYDDSKDKKQDERQESDEGNDRISGKNEVIDKNQEEGQEIGDEEEKELNELYNLYQNTITKYY